MRRYQIGSMLLALCLFPTLMWAEGVIVGTDCQVTWIASTTPNLQAYHLLVSTTKGIYQPMRPAAIVPVPGTMAPCEALHLTEDRQYYLVATAVGKNGVESPYSNEVPFVRQTAGAPALLPDVEPPIILITQPADGGTVVRGSSVVVKVNASDNTSVTRIVVTVNKTRLCDLLTAPYQCSWKVPNTANATYTINAQAMDQSGNNAAAQIEVTAK